MKLAVGFLTYNETTAKYLADFLPSLEAALYFLAPEEYQVYVLDNSSPDNSANRLALEDFDRGRLGNSLPRRPFEYLTYGVNFGFSRAYNILINLAREAKAEYFLVINPDTVLDREALKRLVVALDGNGALGSVAPKILGWDFAGRRPTALIDSLGLQLRPGLRFIDSGQGREDRKDRADREDREDRGSLISQDILGPSGAAGLFRVSALVKISNSDGQYFDERMFMYKEDCDLAYRLFLAGYTSGLVGGALIYHDRTTGVGNRGLSSYLHNRSQKSRLVRAWSFHNQQLIFIKHWKSQNFVNKIVIIYRFLSMFIFSLILEQFLLKEYFSLWREIKS